MVLQFKYTHDDDDAGATRSQKGHPSQVSQNIEARQKVVHHVNSGWRKPVSLGVVTL